MSQNDPRLWLRKVGLVIGQDDGKGVDVSSLRITFAGKKGDNETPNSCEIKVYNLAPETRTRITREYTRVYLSAGYESNYGLIFSGNVVGQPRTYRENGLDTVLELVVADGDEAYNFAVVNTTLAAGCTAADQVRATQNAFAAHGTGGGYIPELGGGALPRGKVMFGMARKYARNVAKNTGCSWSIQDGGMTMVPFSGYVPGEAVVLTSETGLIGTPEQTADGIKVRCLINPRIRVGGRIKLDNASIMTAKSEIKKKDSNDQKNTPRLDDDGFYRILSIEPVGDTHGTDWYFDLLTVGIDESDPKKATKDTPRAK